jgi:hypothetical protein
VSGRCWSRIITAWAAAHDAAVQTIDTSIVRVHQRTASIARNKKQAVGWSRVGLTSKILATQERRLSQCPVKCNRNDLIGFRISIVPEICSSGFSTRLSSIVGRNSLRPTRWQLPRLHPALRPWLFINAPHPNNLFRFATLRLALLACNLMIPCDILLLLRSAGGDLGFLTVHPAKTDKAIGPDRADRERI